MPNRDVPNGFVNTACLNMIAAEFPTEFFIFANQTNFVTRHNLDVTGSFFSTALSFVGSNPEMTQKYLNGTMRFDARDPAKGDCQIFSPFWAGTLQRGQSVDLQLEQDAEDHRLMVDGILPSRLSAVYAFGDEQSCREASSRHGWSMDQVKRFRLEDNPGTRVARVNMEIVSIARSLYATSNINPANTLEIWSAYWKGLSAVPSTAMPNMSRTQPSPIWEYLIEGRVSEIG